MAGPGRVFPSRQPFISRYGGTARGTSGEQEATICETRAYWCLTVSGVVGLGRHQISTYLVMSCLYVIRAFTSTASFASPLNRSRDDCISSTRFLYTAPVL